MKITDSARKHGVADADIRHAVCHPLHLLTRDNDWLLVIAPARAGRLLEIVVLDADDDDDEPVAVHATELRPKFYNQL